MASLCNFPTVNFVIPTFSFSLLLPTLPIFTFAFSFPPACPLD